MAQLKQRIQSLICILITISAGAARGLVLATRSHSAFVAENLFLRKQLAFYQERETRPVIHGRSTGVVRTPPSTRVSLACSIQA